MLIYLLIVLKKIMFCYCRVFKEFYIILVKFILKWFLEFFIICFKDIVKSMEFVVFGVRFFLRRVFKFDERKDLLDRFIVFKKISRKLVVWIVKFFFGLKGKVLLYLMNLDCNWYLYNYVFKFIELKFRLY